MFIVIAITIATVINKRNMLTNVSVQVHFSQQKMSQCSNITAKQSGAHNERKMNPQKKPNMEFKTITIIVRTLKAEIWLYNSWSKV